MSTRIWRPNGCMGNLIWILRVVNSNPVLRGLLDQLGYTDRFAEHSPEVPKLAAAFLDKDCAGARGLSETEIAKLTEIRDRAPPQAAKP
jgi:hypothetical protein